MQWSRYHVFWASSINDVLVCYLGAVYLSLDVEFWLCMVLTLQS